MVLEPGQVRAERERGGAVVTESRAEVLVDVGVDGEQRTPFGCEVGNHQRSQRGLAAAALADERDLHRSYSRVRGLSTKQY